SRAAAGAAAWRPTPGASEATYGPASGADGRLARGDADEAARVRLAGSGPLPATAAGGTTSSEAVAGASSVKWERVASHTGTAMAAAITTYTARRPMLSIARCRRGVCEWLTSSTGTGAATWAFSSGSRSTPSNLA